MMNILNLISNNFPCVFQASVRKGKAGRERALYMYIYTVCAAGCVPAKMEFAHLLGVRKYWQRLLWEHIFIPLFGHNIYL